MDSSFSMADSLIKRISDNLYSSEYDGGNKTRTTPCATVSSAACQACDAGMRSVIECMATLFCPRPKVRLNVRSYQILIATHNELATPLLSRNPQANQDLHADTELLSDSDPVIDDVQLPSLEPLASVTYESLSDEELVQFLRCDGGSTDTSLMDSSSFHAEIPQRH